jgi:hypothetical protein
MTTFSILLFLALILLLLSLVFLVYMALTIKGFSFHGIWDRALRGDRTSRLYMYLVLAAFGCAIAAQILGLAKG